MAGRSGRRPGSPKTARRRSSRSSAAPSEADRARRDERGRPMKSRRPLASYEPNAALAWIYERFFAHIEVDEAWAKQVREADARGTVIYVLRSLSFVDFLALDYLT